MQTQLRPAQPRSRYGSIILGVLIFLAVGILATIPQSPQPKKVGSTPTVMKPAIPMPPFVEIPTPAPRYKIVIDPGHGGKDPGANGTSTMEEKEYTLAIALKIYERLKLEPRVEPFMTRADDRFVGLEERAKLSSDLNADAFISIHGNTFKDSKISGTETYYFSDKSKDLANEIHASLIKVTGFKDRGVRYDTMKVLRYNSVPAVLAEIGYLSNSSNEAILLDNHEQELIAQAIVDGVMHYLSKLK